MVKIAVVGHSFPHRLRQLMHDHPNHFSSHFGIPDLQVDWYTRPGFTWPKFLASDFPQSLQSLCYQLIIIDLATNDLDSSQSVSQLVTLIQDSIPIISHSSNTRIIFMEVLPRHQSSRALSCLQFNSKASQFNDLFIAMYINSRLPSSHHLHFLDPRFWFWQHRRLCNPNLYSPDGVHLRTFPGMKRYYEDIKMSIVRHLRHPLV